MGDLTPNSHSIGELIEAMQKLLAEPDVHKRPIGFVHPAPQPPEPKSTKQKSVVGVRSPISQNHDATVPSEFLIHKCLAI
jgi:hypothetical protein